MAKQTITMYISDTGLRFMLTDGKQITDWSEISFDPGQIEGGVIDSEYEDKIASQVKQILELKSVSVRKALIAISGIRCLTRPIMLPKLPKEILDEAVQREAERLLPVPLNELYMTYQTIPGPDDKTQVFLTAIPKRIVDPLMSTLEKADLKPIFMDLKPLLLARVARQETSILVDVQNSDFDIVIMVKGVPQPVRTVPFALENPTPSEKLGVIREELDRTITFYNSNNPDEPIEHELPVDITGNIEDEVEFCRLLSEEVGREVVMLPSPVETPTGFNHSRYMANIGLFLQESNAGKAAGHSAVNLNTLPPEYQAQSVSSMNILKMLGIACAVIVVALMVVLLQSISSEVDTKRAALETSRTQLQQLQLQTQIANKQITDIKTEITDMQTLQTNLTNALTALEVKSLSLNLDIEATIDRAPGSIAFTQILHENGVLTISGIAPSTNTVDGYITELYSTGRFSDVQIAEMSIQEDETQAFTIRGSLLTDTDWVSSVGVILGNLPGSITLEFASTEENALTLTGNSPDETVLMRYLEKLDDSGKFSEIIIDDISRVDEDDSFEFSVVLRIGE